MKAPRLALAVAPEHALPSAFVVFREPFSSSLRKAAEYGYDGVELALMDRSQVDTQTLKTLLGETGLEVPMISTGQVYAEAGDSFASTDAAVRARAERRFEGLMEVAAEFGALINVGRVRGTVSPNGSRMEVESRVAESLLRLSRRGKELGVRIVVEPVNRYETDLLNSVEEGAAFLDRFGLDGVGLMPDLFHMNIEDVDMAAVLSRYIDKVEYVHFADSNRDAPGRGHMDFLRPLAALRDSGYSGWISLEIFPRPDANTAARFGAIEYRRLAGLAYDTPFTGLEHVGIAASDPATLSAWYMKALGCTCVFDTGEPSPTFFLDLGAGTLLEIFPATENRQEPAPGSGVAALHLALSVSDFDAAQAALDEAGVRWLAPEKRIFLGGRVRFFADPEGNCLHVVHRSLTPWKKG